MSNQLKTRKASDLDAKVGDSNDSSVDSTSSIQSKKKSKHEPSLLLRMLSALIYKSSLKEILGGDISEIDEAIGSSLNARDNFWRSFGYDLFVEAVKAGQVDVVQILLKHTKKADIVSLAKCGKLLFLACTKEYTEIVKLLLEHGFDIGINLMGVQDRTGCKMTCLHVACSKGKLDLIELLLKYGADVSLKQQGFGAMFNYHACYNGRLDLARLLLDHGADINAISSFPIRGDSPLITAVKKNNKAMIQLLLERGADPSIADSDGLTALDYAAKGSEIAQMIADVQLEHILK